MLEPWAAPCTGPWWRPSTYRRPTSSRSSPSTRPPNSFTTPTFLGIQRTDDIGGAGVDGDFGSGTELAVRDFQSDKGLAADGIVAGRTWIALRGTE